MKELNEEQLIELARKAKPVPVEIEGQKKRQRVVHTPLSHFLNISTLKPGRNEMALNIVYDAYLSIAENPMDRNNFYKELKQIFKKLGRNKIKVNIMPITLQEIIKEYNEKKEIK